MQKIENNLTKEERIEILKGRYKGSDIVGVLLFLFIISLVVLVICSTLESNEGQLVSAGAAMMSLLNIFVSNVYEDNQASKWAEQQYKLIYSDEKDKEN